MRNGETECLCGLEIDHQIELGRLFDRNIARLCPAQNLVNNFGERVTLLSAL
jgi:hypothetical protein